jgi:hypothetical protein
MQSIVGTWKLLHATARDAAGAARPLPCLQDRRPSGVDVSHQLMAVPISLIGMYRLASRK